VKTDLMRCFKGGMQAAIMAVQISTVVQIVRSELS
jgi:hypothetical protein